MIYISILYINIGICQVFRGYFLQNFVLKMTKRKREEDSRKSREQDFFAVHFTKKSPIQYE